MYFGNRHYISGFQNRVISRGSGVVEQTHAYCFTCQHTCNVTAVGFHIASVDGTSSTKFKFGFQHLTGVNNLPDNNFYGSGAKDVYLGGTGTPKGWVYVTTDSYNWELKRDSAYAFVIDTYSTALGGPTTTNHITLTVPQPQILDVPYSGLDDPVRRVAWRDLCGAFWQYSAPNSGQTCFYYKGGSGDTADGGSYTYNINQQTLPNRNYTLLASAISGKITQSTAWLGTEINVDSDLYSYSPVLLSISAYVKAWTAVNTPNDDLIYEIRNSGDIVLASAVVATPSQVTEYTFLTSSVKIGGVATALSLTQNETYRFVLRPYNTQGLYEAALMVASPNAYLTKFQSSNGYCKVSRDDGATWGDGNLGNNVYMTGLALQVDFRGQVNGSDFHSCIVASVSGFGAVVTPSGDGSYHLIASGTEEGTAHLKISDYHFEVDPHYLLISSPTCTNWATLIASKGTSMPEATLTDTEMWWDYASANESTLSRGNHYAFRETINFSSSHNQYPIGYVVQQNFPTGYEHLIYSTGDINASIQGESYHQIVRFGAKTYMVFRDLDSKYNVKHYDWNLETYSDAINLGYLNATPTWSGGYTTDTHLNPQLVVDNDGYIWVFVSKHNTGGTYNAQNNNRCTYRKTTNPNDISAWEDVQFVGYNGGVGDKTSMPCTYVRPRVNPLTGDIWIFARHLYEQPGDPSKRLSSNWWRQRFNKTTGLWETCYIIGEFLLTDDYESAWTNHPKSLYCGGVEFDENGICYLLFTYLTNYGNSPQWVVCNQLTWCPDIENGQYVNWFSMGSTCVGGYDAYDGLQYWKITYNDPCWVSTNFIGDSYPQPGSNADHLQLLSHTTTGFHGSTPYSIHIPVIAWTGKRSVADGDYPVWPLITFYDTSISDWRNHYFSTNTGHKLMDALQFGGSVLDDKNQLSIYGYFLPDTAEGSFSTIGINKEWISPDRVYFKSNNSWNTSISFISYIEQRNSNKNLGMFSLNGDYDAGYTIEGIYCREKELYHYQNDKSYGYIREDRSDLCIVYNNQEIPSVVDNVGADNSNVYFKIQSTVSVDSSYPYATRYHAYYGYQSSAWYSSPHVSSIWEIYDSFNQYTETTVTAVSPDFRWETYDGDMVTTANPAIYIVSPSADSIQSLGAANINKHVVGWRSCYYKISGLSTTLCATTLPNVCTSNLDYKAYIRFYDAVSTSFANSKTQFMGIITKNGTVIGFGCGGNNAVGYFIGNGYNNVSYSTATSGLHYESHWEEYFMHITSSNGIEFVWHNSTVYSTGLGKDGVNTAFFGTNGNSSYFDFIRISPNAG